MSRVHGRWGINPPQGDNAPTIGLRDEGAYGDRSHDDTLALERALKKGKRLYGKFTLYVEPGWYRLRPQVLDEYSGIDVIGETINLNLGESPEVGGSNFELINGSNDDLFKIQPTCGVIWFHKIYFRGNQAGQTSGLGSAINYVNSATAKRSGFHTYCRFERWRGGAIRVGTFRDAGEIIRCVVLTCGFEPDGVTPANGGAGCDGVLLGSCNDWLLMRLDSGAHTRYSLYCSGAGTLTSYGTNLFSSKRNLQIDGACGTVDFIGGSIDRSREDGAVIFGPTTAGKGYKRTIANYVFGSNCTAANDTHPDIRVIDDPNSMVSIENPSFNKGSGPNYPKYNIEIAGTTDKLRVLNETLLRDANAPYVTAYCNDLTKLARAYVAQADGPATGYVLQPDNNGVMRKFMTRD